MRTSRIISGPWIILMTMICGLILAACAQRVGQASPPSSQTLSPQGALSGIVMAGPTCPGPATIPERPGCADQPVRDLQLHISRSDGWEITTTTDQQGRFTVTLPPGSYLVTARFGVRGLQSTSVKVIMGQTTTVQITLDTGMR